MKQISPGSRVMIRYDAVQDEPFWAVYYGSVEAVYRGSDKHWFVIDHTDFVHVVEVTKELSGNEAWGYAHDGAIPEIRATDGARKVIFFRDEHIICCQKIMLNEVDISEII